jgi:MEMO1 family protein
MLERPPAVAGSFYPADKRTLQREIQSCLANSDTESRNLKIRSLIVPHAGYVYSGGVAGVAYSQVDPDNYKSVIVVGPSHREHFSYNSVLVEGSYSTPIGTIPVDKAIAEEIVNVGLLSVKAKTNGHAIHDMGEHNLEVQLPFLQEIFKDIPGFVPIVMGSQNRENSHELALAIVKACEKRAPLLIASTDLSHFYRDDVARMMDKHILTAIENFDLEELWRVIETGEGEACGYGPMATVLEASKLMGCNKTKVLEYATSGDVEMGDKSRVVGYFSAMFHS